MINKDKNIKLIEFPKIENEKGNISFMENYTHIPFEIKRVYWIYDVPGGQQRGGYAFLKQEEVIVAISGSFDVLVNDGVVEKLYTLNRSYHGLYIPKKTWRTMQNFSTNSVALVLSSTFYEESDYIRNFDEFKAKI